MLSNKYTATESLKHSNILCNFDLKKLGTDNVDQRDIEPGSDNKEQRVLDIEPGSDNVEQRVLDIEPGSDNVEQRVLDIESGPDSKEVGHWALSRPNICLFGWLVS